MRTAIAVVFLSLFGACRTPLPESASPDPAPEVTPEVTPVLPDRFPHSMKGYTLYAYVRADQTHSTLITGTNRLKTFEELDGAESVVGDDGWVRVRVAGVERATDLLRRVPADSGVFVTTIRHVSVAQSTVPSDVTAPPESALAELRAIR